MLRPVVAFAAAAAGAALVWFRNDGWWRAVVESGADRLTSLLSTVLPSGDSWLALSALLAPGVVALLAGLAGAAAWALRWVAVLLLVAGAVLAVDAGVAVLAVAAVIGAGVVWFVGGLPAIGFSAAVVGGSGAYGALLGLSDVGAAAAVGALGFPEALGWGGVLLALPLPLIGLRAVAR